MYHKPHIVIAGAGFGGMYVAKQLVPYVKSGEISVTLVNRTNYFLFTPLLHEVATGGLSPMSVAEPLRGIFEDTGVQIYQGEVASIDAAKKSIHVGSCDIPYDYLVVATGAETNYYNIPGAETYGMALKNLKDAVSIRDRIIDAFESAVLAHSKGETSSALNFVVVGGGATGVETAAELAEFICEIQDRYYHKVKFFRKQDVSITLVSTTTLLKQYHVKIQKAAERRLRKLGIKLLFGAEVAEVTQEKIAFKNGESIPAGMVIWAAGVKAQVPSVIGQAPVLISGRIHTDAFLRALGAETVFALGDNAAPNGSPAVPMLAQVATAQASIVTKNILATIENRRLTPYKLHLKGTLVSLGQWYAAGEIYSMKFYGRLAWFIWRTVYYFKFFSWRKRIRISFEWTINLFYPRDITKLR